VPSLVRYCREKERPRGEPKRVLTAQLCQFSASCLRNDAEIATALHDHPAHGRSTHQSQRQVRRARTVQVPSDRLPVDLDESCGDKQVAPEFRVMKSVRDVAEKCGWIIRQEPSKRLVRKLRIRVAVQTVPNVEREQPTGPSTRRASRTSADLSGGNIIPNRHATTPALAPSR
jgi:hypothetical protein